MKHLKYITEHQNENNQFSQDDMDNIMDAFQDLIDEYDIETNDNDESEAVAYNILYVTPNDRKYYKYPKIKNKEPIKFINGVYYKTGPIKVKVQSIIIRIYLPITIDNKKFFSYEKEAEILKDAEDFNKRLNLMNYNSSFKAIGYRTDTVMPNYIQCIDINIPTTF